MPNFNNSIKQCKNCKEWKPVTKFYSNPKTADKLTSFCKDCTNKSSKDSRKKYRTQQETLADKFELLIKRVEVLEEEIKLLKNN